MEAGEPIKLRDQDGTRWWGRITAMQTSTEPIDVTRDPAKGGPGYREFAPGRTTVTLTIELTGPR